MKTDADIKKDILDDIKKNPVLNTACIQVDVMGGAVYLTGKVDSYRKKSEVENAARNFAGIEKIHLAIHVDLPPDTKPTDAQIKDEILNFLHFSLPENDILVRIYEGIVVLTGEAGSEQEKKNVMTVISGIPGILNIWNFIRVKYDTTPINYKERNKKADSINMQVVANKTQFSRLV